MIRRISCLIVVILAVLATACGGHKAPQTTPNAPAQVAQLPPPVPLIQSCWDPIVRGQYGEWFDNTLSNTPVLFKVEDKATGNLICFGVVRPGGRQMGPAIWAHLSATSDWAVTGTSYVTGVNSNRTEGMVDGRPVRLEYVRGHGWYTRCPC